MSKSGEEQPSHVADYDDYLWFNSESLFAVTSEGTLIWSVPWKDIAAVRVRSDRSFRFSRKAFDFKLHTGEFLTHGVPGMYGLIEAGLLFQHLRVSGQEWAGC